MRSPSSPLTTTGLRALPKRSSARMTILAEPTLILVLVAGAVVPTVIANAFFLPRHLLPPERDESEAAAPVGRGAVAPPPPGAIAAASARPATGPKT
jgi:hypothetical protein